MSSKYINWTVLYLHLYSDKLWLQLLKTDYSFALYIVFFFTSHWHMMNQDVLYMFFFCCFFKIHTCKNMTRVVDNWIFFSNLCQVLFSKPKKISWESLSLLVFVLPVIAVELEFILAAKCERRGKLWTGWQSITGLTQAHKMKDFACKMWKETRVLRLCKHRIVMQTPEDHSLNQQ